MLSEIQQKAVETTEGPLLIFAGAGSGKTRVITNRITHLIRNKHISPKNILAVTFTNKAANEMKERVGKMLNDEELSKKLTISTFHSLCLKILKIEHALIGYPGNFVLYTPYEELELMKKIMEENKVSKERFSPRQMLYTIANMKNNPDLIKNRDYFMMNPTKLQAKKLLNPFLESMKAAGAMDFDDLLINTLKLFKENDDIRIKYSQKYQYIMVDEYQDTNTVQYELVKMLSSVHKNICVVGDDDQSIYSWRGAKVENILNFQKDFEGCQVVKLEQNYRSVDEIVSAASRLIGKNSVRAEKKVFTKNKTKEGEGIEIKTLLNEEQEAEFVANQVIALSHKGLSIKDIAVLLRTNSQTRFFEMAFNKKRIPYKIIGGRKFFENKEIKDLIAYLRILVNKKDEISFRRIINYPARKIGASTQQMIFAEITKTLSTPEIIEKMIENQKLSSVRKKALEKFLNLYNNLAKQMTKMKPVDFVRFLIQEIEIEDEIKKSAESEKIAQIRLENISAFINAVASEYEANSEKSNFGFFIDFINSVSLVQSGDESEKEKGLNIITAHSAKGLEFDTVFLVGFYNGGMPHAMSIKEGNIEEERRLCYVAFTRAKKRLIITIPQMVRKQGKIMPVGKSIFLMEAGLDKIQSGMKKKMTTEEKKQKIQEFIDRMRK